jgi:DNA-binding NarL/FixJ family response regulator
MPATILLVDDRPLLQVAMNRLLRQHFCGSDVVATDDSEEAFRLAETQPQIAVVSYLFRKGNVLSLAEGIQRQSGMTQILFIAMHESWTAIEVAIRCGVRGLLLDSDPPELLVSAIEALSGGYAFFSPRIALLCAHAHSNTSDQPNICDLTARELEIFKHLSRGESNKTMAFQLNISVKTVEAHRAKLLKKLHVRSTVELVRWALRQKLIQL